MLFLLELKSFNKPCKDIPINWKFLREAFSPINMFFQSLWKIMDTWMKVSMKSLNVYTVVLNQWLHKIKPRLFTSDVHLKNVMKEQSKEKEHNKIKFLWNTCKKFTSNTKIGSKITIKRRSWYLTQQKILKMTKQRFNRWLIS